MKLEITPRIFFISGIIAFSVIGLANLANFFIFYANGNFFSRLVSIMSILFNLVTVGFFYYLLNSSGGGMSLEGVGDIKEALGEFDKEINN